MSPLSIEMKFVRAGGYLAIGNRRYGMGLFAHYKAYQRLLWPQDHHHRWSDLILEHELKERLVVVQGGKDSGKTHVALARFALSEYYLYPQTTLELMSSTDLRGLELRVWGEIKDMHRQATELYPWLPGQVSDTLKGIFTDKLDGSGNVRDLRKGIIAVPILDNEGNETKALEKFVGVKQEHRRLLGDELQFIPVSYLQVLDNLDSGDFKAVFTGNPLGQRALDKVAEPMVGWANMAEPKKTTTWRNKYGGVTICLVGTDSPNFDFIGPKRFPYLIGREDVDRLKDRLKNLAIDPLDSIQFCSQILGVRRAHLNPRIVLPEELCRQNGAYEHCVWGHQPITKILALDAGFGGDDCDLMLLEFGHDITGNPIIKFHEPETIAVSAREQALSVEDQIAGAVSKRLASLNVPPANFFFEAGMRATLAVSLAKISPEVNAINAGGPATDRPVSSDLYVEDKDGRRLKRCDEHYVKFITQMWFSVRVVVENRQARELPHSVSKQFSEREWSWAKGDRYELESKPDFKQRCGYSPNKADATSIGVEGAIRRGFVLRNLRGDSIRVSGQQDDWLEKAGKKYRNFIQKHELKYR